MNEAYSQSWTKTSDASSDSDSVLSVNQDELPSKSKENKPDGNDLFNFGKNNEEFKLGIGKINHTFKLTNH